MVAQSWLIYEISGSAFYLGLAGLMQAIPRFIFSPFGGVAADRFNKKQLLYVTQTASKCLAFLLGILDELHVIKVWHILLVSFANSAVMSFDQPTRQAMIPDLVGREDLLNAIALNSIAFNGAAVLGPSVGGYILATIGAPGCFLLNGLSFTAVIGALYSMKIPGGKGGRRQSHGLWRDICEGITELRRNLSMIASLLLISSISFLGRPYVQMMPAFAKDVLRVGPQELGLLMAAPGMGTIAGSLILTSIGSLMRLEWLVIVSSVFFALALICLGWTKVFYLACLILILTGSSQTMAMATTNTLLQTTAAPQVRGRVVSIYTMLHMGLNPLGAFPAGAIAAKAGVPFVLRAGGFSIIAVIVLVTVWVYFSGRKMAFPLRK